MTEQEETPDWELIATKLAWTLSRVLPDNAQAFAELIEQIENDRERIAMEEANGIDSKLSEIHVDARLCLLLPDEHAAFRDLNWDRHIVESYRSMATAWTAQRHKALGRLRQSWEEAEETTR